MTGTFELDKTAFAAICDRVGLARGTEPTQEDGWDVAASWTRFIVEEWTGVSPINPVDMHCRLFNGFGVIDDPHQLLLVTRVVAAALTESYGFAEADARDTSVGVRIFARR
ncbi:MAG TPA: hypothetical protein VGH44_03275 [Candidatus Saccharimonadia bacterium]|jgi:hypothetical protein